MEKAIAFLKKDYKQEVSYRLSFLMQFFNIFFTVTIFFFVSKLFGRSISTHLADYGGNYFSFVLIGIAFAGFLGTGLRTFSATISSQQAQGTLESILVTPTKLSSLVTLSSLWSFLFTAFSVFVYLLFGVLVFGLDLSKANVAVALIILFQTILIFSGIGIISASFIMVLKRGDPINWLFGSVSSLIGGTFFPVTIFPVWVQKFSYAVPLFYTLRAMRHAVLQGYSFGALFPDIIVLAIFSAAIIPLSLISFKWAVKRAKIDGSLVTY